MSLLSIAIILVSLFLVELIYFKIADRFNIIDKPNARSSHHAITLRGGGVIFTISIVLWFLFYRLQFPYFFIGLLAITVVSFIDDVITLNNKIRLAVHLSAVLLLFFQWNLFSLPWYWLIIALVFVIGTINAYNFMDGINGITGSFSLLAIATLYYINKQVVSFTDSDLLIIVGLSLIVFNFFNFRNKAKCFAGDVGSVSIAFVLIFLIGQLILVTHNFGYILLLLVYGLDTATTVFFRKLRKENIFEAHRNHFYQYLANEKKIPQLYISAGYMLVQFIINSIILYFDITVSQALIIAIFGLIVFIGIRFHIEGRTRLLIGTE